MTSFRALTLRSCTRRSAQPRDCPSSRGNVAPNGVGLLTARTLVGYMEAQSGRQLIIAVMVRDVPFRSLEELFAVVADNAEIAVAMQAGY